MYGFLSIFSLRKLADKVAKWELFELIEDMATYGFANYTVAKISDDGNTLEQAYSTDTYPTEENPDVPSYFIGYKK